MRTSLPLCRTAFRVAVALSRGAPRLVAALLSLLSLPVLLVAAQQARAQDDVQTPGAPVITRAVSVDLDSEKFTIFWRPPENNGGAEILQYRIERSQTDRIHTYGVGGEDGAVDPVGCDSDQVTYVPKPDLAVLTDPDTFTRVFNVGGNSPSGDSHGICYRWRVSARNTAGWGLTVTTAPVFSRPADTCPDSQTRSLFGGCVGSNVLEGADWCKRLQTHLPSHVVNLTFDRDQDDGDDRYDFACLVNKSDYDCDGKLPAVRRGLHETLCPLNLEKSVYCGDLSEYSRDHRECLCKGYAIEKEVVSSSVHNIRGDVTCECNVQGADNNCECPVGMDYRPDLNFCGNQCQVAGWAMTVYADGTEACLIPVLDDISREFHALCGLSGTVQGAPACSEAFGENLDFPLQAIHSPGVSYIYNCPPGQNPHATRFNCVCPSGSRDIGGKCVDINECRVGNYQCPAEASCRNTLNGHSCDCPVGYNFNAGTGECACSETTGSDGECRTWQAGLANCKERGWKSTVYIVADGSGPDRKIGGCAVPIRNGTTNTTHDRCFLAEMEGRGPGAEIPCLNVFPDYDFPVTTTHREGERYVYECPGSEFLSADRKSCVACPPGHMKAGEECVDINECEPTNPCGGGSQCDNLPGFYSCSCLPGFARAGLEPHDPQCADINECELGTHACGSRDSCVNTPGGRTCACQRAGWTMTIFANGDSACLIPVLDDVKRQSSPFCALSGTAQGAAPACSEIFGDDLDFPQQAGHISGASYIYNCPTAQNPDADRLNCVCPPGTADIGDNCAEINECETGVHQCPSAATCVNAAPEDGFYSCQCPPHYHLSGGKCVVQRNGDQACRDKKWPAVTDDGAVYCNIPFRDETSGATFERCVILDALGGNGLPCVDVFPGYDFPVKTTATHSPGDYFVYNCPEPKVPSADRKSCECPSGYDNSDGNCLISNDIDECAAETPACGANAACTNTPGNYECACNPGYARIGLDPHDPQCVDINECELGTHACGSQAACANTPGGRDCACQGAGWTLTIFADGAASCRVPVRNGTSKEAWSHCNLAGTARGAPDCSAVFGDSLDFPPENGHSEGESYVYDCPNNQIPDPAGTGCVCPPGFTDIGDNCANIDECAAGTHQCPSNAPCQDAVGGYSCQCPLGYQYDNAGSCVCNDDLAALIGLCDEQSPQHINASFVGTACADNGWDDRVADGNRDCVIPIRNAAVGAEQDRCAISIFPAYADIPLCTDIFPGADFPPKTAHSPGDRYVYNCPDAKVPSADRKSCICPPGFDNSDGTCVEENDINECETGIHACEDNASCVNTPGSHACVCNPGYARTALSAQNPQCAEINECVNNTHACGSQAACSNTPGGHACPCQDAGWTLTIFADGAASCRVPVRNGTSKEAWSHCNLAGAARGAPDCSEVFGDSLDFPPEDGHSEGESYVYDCPNSQILDTAGTGCVCPPGTADIGDNCAEINECESGAHQCPSDAVCVNAAPEDGFYSCQCPFGYHLSGGECVCNDDNILFDQCVVGGGEGSDACADSGWTVKPDGSLYCVVPVRDASATIAADAEREQCVLFIPSNKGEPLCTDVFPDYDFPVKTTATYSEGDYYVYNCPDAKVPSADRKSCECPPGYDDSDGICAEENDINECETGIHACEDNASCVNTPGSHACVCNPGYARTALSAQNPQCAEINECAVGDHACGNNADCVNTPGGHVCACQSAGWTLTVFSDGGKACRIPVRNGDSGQTWRQCNFVGTTYRAPNCSAVFGAPLDFPLKANHQPGDFYAYDCPGGRVADPDRTGCVCPSGRQKNDGICVEIVSVSFPPPDNGTLSAESAESPVYNGGDAERGATITFTAAPDDGWRVSIWTGHCADAAGKSCAVVATLNVSVAVAFSDINECAANTHDCAAIGGQCDNAEGGFICSCAAGYSGDGKTCHPDKTVSFPPVDNGTISAASAGAGIRDGDAVAHGTTVTFAAAPAYAHRLSAWFGDCAGRYACQVVATMNVSVSAAFTDIDECRPDKSDCAPSGGLCANTGGIFTCGCISGHSGNGQICNPDITVSFQQPGRGTLSAASGVVSVYNGDAAVHGTMIDFTAAPNKGWRVSAWFGDCAGATGDSCAVNATMNVSVSVAFSDIDECAINTHDCAPVGGQCANIGGGFTCRCLPGYFGNGKTCAEARNVEIIPSSNGTILADYLEHSLSGQMTRSTAGNGQGVPREVTVRFRAVPDSGFYVRQWTHNCAAVFAAPASARALSLAEQTCELHADQDLQVGAIFERAWRVALPAPPNGTVSARIKGGDALESPRNAVPHQTTVIYTVQPNDGHYIAGWRPGKPGNCGDQYQKPDIKSAAARECEAVVNSPLFRTSPPEPMIAPLPCLAIPGARSAAMDTCECETDGHFIFGAAPNLVCAPPTMCPKDYAGSDCIPAPANAEAARDASARLPERANAPDACRGIFGGVMQTAGNNQTVCSDVDRNDTFCIVGSRDAFPCRGIFNHVWKCNQHNRPALNPFFCDAPCAGGENASRGRYCGKNAVADDMLN